MAKKKKVKKSEPIKQATGGLKQRLGKVKQGEVTTEICSKRTKNPIDPDVAMELLGWEEEGEDEKWGNDYAFRIGDRKIRLKNNPNNRPFRMALARRYANEMLRGKWYLNGETIVIDEKGWVQSAQHRLVGLLLAEEMRSNDHSKWGDRSITIDVVVVRGISSNRLVTDTLDLGQKRSLGDIIYRNQEFEGISDQQIKKLSNAISYATRLVWLRTDGKKVSDAPHFPHSEALDFLEQHPRIIEAAQVVHKLEGGRGAEGRRITHYISLGYAAGLFYMMAAAATTEDEIYDGVVNFDLWDKAEGFWSQFASGANLDEGNPILELRNYVHELDSGASAGRDEIIGTIIKAYNCWTDKVKMQRGGLKLKRAKNPDNSVDIIEFPSLGGIDAGGA